MHYLITFLFLLTGSFLSINVDSGDPLFTPEELEQASTLISEYSGSDYDAIDAGMIYKQNCSSCHGRKGGLGLAGATNLKTSELSLEERVAMVYFGKNKMQSYKEALKPEELVAVAQYLETLRN